MNIELSLKGWQKLRTMKKMKESCGLDIKNGLRHLVKLLEETGSLKDRFRSSRPILRPEERTNRTATEMEYLTMQSSSTVCSVQAVLKKQD